MNAMPEEIPMEEFSVRASITVKASIDRAFRVYTEGFNIWWPREHKLGKATLDKAVIEPHAGGRWYERTVDGAECTWGYVLAWEPPGRLVLSWHINQDWVVNPDPAHASEIEVRFIAEGPKLTRVELEHRHLDRHAGPEAGRKIIASINAMEGWPGIFLRYAEAVAADVA
jgi:uncharacterized protein YndB with AHSA1/START domain